METEKTVQEFFKLWFWNFQNPSQNQFSNLYHITIAIMKYFNQKEKDPKENYSNQINNMLPKLFYKPLETLIQKNKYLNIKSKNDWSIPQIEWCYYRDTKFRTKLAKEYYSDSTKQQESQKLHLQDIISILAAFKDEMFEKIIQILLDEKLDIYIPIPIKEIEQIGAE